LREDGKDKPAQRAATSAKGWDTIRGVSNVSRPGGMEWQFLAQCEGEVRRPARREVVNSESFSNSRSSRDLRR